MFCLRFMLKPCYYSTNIISRQGGNAEKFFKLSESSQKTLDKSIPIWYNILSIWSVIKNTTKRLILTPHE